MDNGRLAMRKDGSIAYLKSCLSPQKFHCFDQTILRVLALCAIHTVTPAVFRFVVMALRIAIASEGTGRRAPRNSPVNINL
jgi:hypothetical protein